MITYESVCKKLGFDPIVDDVDFFSTFLIMRTILKQARSVFFHRKN